MSGCPEVVVDYYDPVQCDLDAPLAEDSPWTVYDVQGGTPVGPAGQGQYAEKIVGSVVISAEMDGNQGGVNGRFAQPNPAVPPGSGGGGMPSGAADHNALTVLQNRVGGVSHAHMRFSVSVPQPGFQIRFIDVDGTAQNNETLRTAGSPFGDDKGFGPFNLGEADSVIPYMQGPGGNPNSQIVHTNNGAGGPGYWAPTTAGEASAILIYRDQPWGNGTPANPGNGAPAISTAFTMSPGSGGRGSQYDFGGQIQQRPCSFIPRQARFVCCGGRWQWIDTETGAVLSERPG